MTTIKKLGQAAGSNVKQSAEDKPYEYKPYSVQQGRNPGPYRMEVGQGSRFFGVGEQMNKQPERPDIPSRSRFVTDEMIKGKRHRFFLKPDGSIYAQYGESVYNPETYHVDPQTGQILSGGEDSQYMNSLARQGQATNAQRVQFAPPRGSTPAAPAESTAYGDMTADEFNGRTDEYKKMRDEDPDGWSALQSGDDPEYKQWATVARARLRSRRETSSPPAEQPSSPGLQIRTEGTPPASTRPSSSTTSTGSNAVPDTPTRPEADPREKGEYGQKTWDFKPPGPSGTPDQDRMIRILDAQRKNRQQPGSGWLNRESDRDYARSIGIPEDEIPPLITIEMEQQSQKDRWRPHLQPGVHGELVRSLPEEVRKGQAKTNRWGTKYYPLELFGEDVQKGIQRLPDENFQAQHNPYTSDRPGAPPAPIVIGITENGHPVILSGTGEAIPLTPSHRIHPVTNRPYIPGSAVSGGANLPQDKIWGGYDDDKPTPSNLGQATRQTQVSDRTAPPLRYSQGSSDAPATAVPVDPDRPELGMKNLNAKGEAVTPPPGTQVSGWTDPDTGVFHYYQQGGKPATREPGGFASQPGTGRPGMMYGTGPAQDPRSLDPNKAVPGYRPGVDSRGAMGPPGPEYGQTDPDNPMGLSMIQRIELNLGVTPRQRRDNNLPPDSNWNSPGAYGTAPRRPQFGPGGGDYSSGWRGRRRRAEQADKPSKYDQRLSRLQRKHDVAPQPAPVAQQAPAPRPQPAPKPAAPAKKPYPKSYEEYQSRRTAPTAAPAQKPAPTPSAAQKPGVAPAPKPSSQAVAQEPARKPAPQTPAQAQRDELISPAAQPAAQPSKPGIIQRLKTNKQNRKNPAQAPQPRKPGIIQRLKTNKQNKQNKQKQPAPAASPGLPPVDDIDVVVPKPKEPSVSPTPAPGKKSRPRKKKRLENKLEKLSQDVNSLAALAWRSYNLQKLAQDPGYGTVASSIPSRWNLLNPFAWGSRSAAKGIATRERTLNQNMGYNPDSGQRTVKQRPTSANPRGVVPKGYQPHVQSEATLSPYKKTRQQLLAPNENSSIGRINSSVVPQAQSDYLKKRDEIEGRK